MAFPPDYEPRGLKTKIKDRFVTLEPLQEEMLMAWAKKVGTPYVEDEVFQNNFLFSLREQWSDLFADVKIEDIDWREMVAIAQSEKLANLPDEVRKERSLERKKKSEELKARFGHATVDDHEVEVGAYLIEPPSIFMGRGEHPLRGRWKPRVYSHQVTLNLDEEAPVPPADPKREGENAPRWDKVVHEHNGLWIARWEETLTKKIKYVWLAETSHLRQEREQMKYDKATTLGENIKPIKAAISRAMSDKDENRRKVATVAYLISRLAMRVGDEKDADEADTVGASTLRIEHISISETKINFDFLGKDSVPWKKTLEIESEDDRQLAQNLERFSKGRNPSDQLFPEITSGRVNQFFKTLKNSKGKVIMKDLSAKVFRTFLATNEVKRNLPAPEEIENRSVAYIEYRAKQANLRAAELCNHKRTPPKTWAESLAKREESVVKLRHSKPDLGRLDDQIKVKRAALDKLVNDQKEFDQNGPESVKKKQEARVAFEAKGAPTDQKKLKEYQKKLKTLTKAERDAEKLLKQRTKSFKERVSKAHKALASAEEARTRAETGYNERLERAELQLSLVRETKDYALNTSLKNYIDPRAYRDWAKDLEFEWKKLYTGSLQKKFTWAMRDGESDDGVTSDE